MGIKLREFGHFTPEHIISNSELTEKFNLTENWIVERTGIEERRYFKDGASTDMAVLAVEDMLQGTALVNEKIDCIIFATTTPDFLCPSAASVLQKKLNLNHTFAFDIKAACSGFLFGLEMASALLESKKYSNILLIGADKLSSIVNPHDLKTSVIFGDGAGSVLISYSKNENHLKNIICKVDSTELTAVSIENGGSQNPILNELIESSKNYVSFNSKKISGEAVKLFIKATTETLAENNLNIESIDMVIPHQANKRIIEELSKRLNLPIEKFYINIEQRGNTGAASIPTSLSILSKNKKLKGTILLIAVGAGFAYSGAILKI